MKKRRKSAALFSLALAAVFTLGVAGCGQDDESAEVPGGPGTPSFVPVDPINYNYDRFNDNANFVKPVVDDSGWDGVKSEELTDGYEKGTSRAPQTSKYLGMVTPVKPVAGVRDEHVSYGVTQYPSYGKKIASMPVAEFRGMVQECRSLIPSTTWSSTKVYDSIDSEGYLLKGGQRIPYTTSGGIGGDEGDGGDGDIISGGDSGEEQEIAPGSTAPTTQYSEPYRKLYKHTTADTLYGGGLSDDEPRIVKEVTCLTRTGIGSKQITGLYAPAGEVVKVEISQKDLEAAGGSFHIYIGQNYNIDKNDNVSMEWRESGGVATGKGNGITRMPNILSHFVINETTSYVGSFWGGPIYFRPGANGNEKEVTVKISGGVRYQHFILGATTEEEYNANKNSTAPYFDLEIYDSAIRFTTGIFGAAGLKSMTYENCTDAAILWDKITQVSTRVQANGLSSSKAPVNFIGDVYIAAGAAYANPGRNGVVCPPGWVYNALNYNAFVNSGSWGAMHEYNHCWQGYGFGNGGEVTNNATTLVSHTLYTRISQGRTASPNGGLGGWNRFTDPAKALGELLTIREGSGGTQKCFDLSVYATLLHNIGQENFVTAARGGRENASTVYYNKLVEATHYDMTYFVNKVLNYNIAEADAKGTISKAAADEVKAKNYPMFVPVSSVYQVGRSILYGNEKHYITTAQPFVYGSGEYVMDFNDRNNFSQGSFVSKGLVIPDGFTAKVISVTQPQNGSVELLENNYVKYTPKSGNGGLYSGNFRVKLRIVKDDREFIVEDVDLVINLKQSANDVRRTTYTYGEASQVPDTAAVYNAQTNTFDFGDYNWTETIKNVCTQNSNTEIWTPDKNYYDDAYNSASTNFRQLEAGKTIQTLDGYLYFADPGTYRLTLRGRYGKSTLYLSYDDGESWENALSIRRQSWGSTGFVEGEYTEHTFTGANNYVRFKVVLNVENANTFFGLGVSARQPDGTFPAFVYANGAVTNPNVHRMAAEDAAKKFETEYMFKGEYKYSFTTDESYGVGSLVSVSHAPWKNSASYAAANMFDGNGKTYYLSNGSQTINENNPFELVADLGRVCKVNRMTFYGFNGTVGTNNGMPVTFSLYGSINGTDYDLLLERVDAPADARNITYELDETEIRYYKLVVTKTDNNKTFGMNRIVFDYEGVTYADGTVIAPNDFGVRYVGNWTTQNTLCTFGLLYSANAGDSAEFHFNGTRFAYFAYQSQNYGTVDIYVDGTKIASGVDLSADKNGSALAYMYLGDALSEGDHVVKVVGVSGGFNVDSFVYWA